MAKTRRYLVLYDISDPKRLRRVERIVSGYGYRVQFSVFLCLLSDTEKSILCARMDEVIHASQDQCCIIDMGKSDDLQADFLVLGRPMIKIPKITFL